MSQILYIKALHQHFSPLLCFSVWLLFAQPTPVGNPPPPSSWQNQSNRERCLQRNKHKTKHHLPKLKHLFLYACSALCKCTFLHTCTCAHTNMRAHTHTCVHVKKLFSWIKRFFSPNINHFNEISTTILIIIKKSLILFWSPPKTKVCEKCCYMVDIWCRSCHILFLLKSLFTPEAGKTHYQKYRAKGTSF